MLIQFVHVLWPSSLPTSWDFSPVGVISLWILNIEYCEYTYSTTIEHKSIYYNLLFIFDFLSIFALNLHYAIEILKTIGRLIIIPFCERVEHTRKNGYSFWIEMQSMRLINLILKSQFVIKDMKCKCYSFLLPLFSFPFFSPFRKIDYPRLNHGHGITMAKCEPIKWTNTHKQFIKLIKTQWFDEIRSEKKKHWTWYSR